MDIALQGHFAQRYGMRLPVVSDELRASGPGGELLNQRGPLLPRNGVATKQVSEHRLVGQFGGKDGR